MKEDFLYYLWKLHKLPKHDLCTTTGHAIEILKTGYQNTLSGPDFFNASLLIDKQQWVGTVEMHVRSSDWFAHGHEKDDAYNNVILHVVWEHDVDVFNSLQQPIPVLEVQSYISKDLLNEYERVATGHYHFIPCEYAINEVSTFMINNWLERLFIERLAQKTVLINELLQKYHHNWEAVCFIMLMKSFGSKINSESFLTLSQSFSFDVFRKTQQSQTGLEALLFGQAGLLTANGTSSYEQELWREYQYLVAKYKLTNATVQTPEFFKLRPFNFPTVRLAQLASLYSKHQSIFTILMASKNEQDVFSLFDAATHSFWDTHYTFSKTSNKKIKRVSKAFVELLIINVVLPLKFVYGNYKGKQVTEEVLQFAAQLKAEKNTIINGFEELKLKVESAKTSQACLQLYNEYCSKKRCLQCQVGVQILSKK